MTTSAAAGRPAGDKGAGPSNRTIVYRAPGAYVWVFYALLTAWTVACVVLIGAKAARSGWGLGQLAMIGFVLAYTWYFSLGIAFRARVGEAGELVLTSFKKEIRFAARAVEAIESPKFSVGFLRFRLAREKVYLFCTVKDQALQGLLAATRSANPEIKFKH